MINPEIKEDFIFFSVESPREAMIVRFVAGSYGSVIKVGNYVILKPNDEHSFFLRRLAQKIIEKSYMLLEKVAEGENTQE